MAYLSSIDIPDNVPQRPWVNTESVVTGLQRIIDKYVVGPRGDRLVDLGLDRDDAGVKPVAKSFAVSPMEYDDPPPWRIEAEPGLQNLATLEDVMNSGQLHRRDGLKIEEVYVSCRFTRIEVNVFHIFIIQGRTSFSLTFLLTST
jgi:hypothetical protein